MSGGTRVELSNYVKRSEVRQGYSIGVSRKGSEGCGGSVNVWKAPRKPRAAWHSRG